MRLSERALGVEGVGDKYKTPCLEILLVGWRWRCNLYLMKTDQGPKCQAFSFALFLVRLGCPCRGTCTLPKWCCRLSCRFRPRCGTNRDVPLPFSQPFLWVWMRVGIIYGGKLFENGVQYRGQLSGGMGWGGRSAYAA